MKNFFLLFAEISADIMEWRKVLKKKYCQELSQIRFRRSRRAVADTENIFVQLTLVGDDKQKELKSYQDLFHLSDNKGKTAAHVLLRGKAGSGKTTLVSRIAYEWSKISESELLYKESASNLLEAVKTEKCAWKVFELVFVFEVRKLRSGQSLEQVIKSHLLPNAKPDRIAEIIGKLGDRCLIAVDGFDEIRSNLEDHALESPLLSQCFVIVTTRPHMVDQFCMQTKLDYVQVNISGFSKNNRYKYIQRFFNITKKPALAGILMAHIDKTSIFTELSSYPIVLLMMCQLTASQGQNVSFGSMTNLYQKAVMHLNKPFESKRLSNDIHDVIVSVGSSAFEALLENDLQINKAKFEDEIMLEQSFELGITFEEEGYLRDEVYVTFIHKTFQEFCAAVFFSRLCDFDKDKFHHFLDAMINKENVHKVHQVEYVLRFCCGLNISAAKAILCHYVKHASESNGSAFDKWRLSLILVYEVTLTHGKEEKNMSDIHDCLRNMDCKSTFHVDQTDVELVEAFNLFTKADSKQAIWNAEVWLTNIRVVHFKNMKDVNDVLRLMKSLPSIEELILDTPIGKVENEVIV